jgi:hypothetical protein
LRGETSGQGRVTRPSPLHLPAQIYPLIHPRLASTIPRRDPQRNVSRLMLRTPQHIIHPPHAHVQRINIPRDRQLAARFSLRRCKISVDAPHIRPDGDMPARKRILQHRAELFAVTAARLQLGDSPFDRNSELVGERSLGRNAHSRNGGYWRDRG